MFNSEDITDVPSAPYRFESDLDVTANRSGVYWCRATNPGSLTPARAAHRFFVSGQSAQVKAAFGCGWDAQRYVDMVWVGHDVWFVHAKPMVLLLYFSLFNHGTDRRQMEKA